MSVADERRLKLWPHLRNVARLENYIRDHANQKCEMLNLRVGLFAGQRYRLGLLPLLVPRLKTHLVPWVANGSTSLPIIAGSDIGNAFSQAAASPQQISYRSYNIVGPDVPTAREVISYLNEEYGIPKPHFNVPFSIAYLFARTMKLIDPIVPWEPLVTRSIIHLLEETSATNERAHIDLGFTAKVHW